VPALHLATVDLPVLGRLRVAASARGLRGLAFIGRGDDLPIERWTRTGWTITTEHVAVLADAIGQLSEYASGRRRIFTVPIDLDVRTTFTTAILAACARIPFGAVASYGDLATQVGSPGAARAVGQAMGSNPLPIVIPCHRVVASGGRLGGFSPGGALKTELLAHEGVAVRDGRLVDGAAGPRSAS